jgi:osmoprotectant transport system ATP-binding protein
MQHELLRLQEELGKTILFVTHDIAEAIALGDKIVILAKGAHIAQQGSPAEIMANPKDDFVASFLGLDGARSLHVDGRLVVDPTGRPVGRLS